MRELYDLAKWGPTAANTTPARFVFVRTAAAKERLKPHLMGNNVDKTMAASCCVIVAYDSRFYDLLGKLFPSRDMRSAFVGNAPLIEETAKRNSTLQGAYMMLAARSLGLDCGPKSRVVFAEVIGRAKRYYEKKYGIETVTSESLGAANAYSGATTISAGSTPWLAA